MKPRRQQLQTLCPDVDAEFIAQHLRRLDEEYFERFPLDRVTRHLSGLASLSPSKPAEVLVEFGASGGVECTVLAFDYPSEFSLVTGVLFAMGLSIRSGDVFTYRAEDEAPTAAVRGRRPGRPRPPQKKSPLHRRRIIDHFVGVTDSDRPSTWGAEARTRLLEVITLLERGDPESVEAAKHRVNEMVTRRLAALDSSRYPVFYPAKLEIDDTVESATRLRVASQDTPAFLYAVSNALSLMGLAIQHVRIRTRDGQIEDEIDLVDPSGQPVRDPDLLARIQLSVLLTKQCTYFLDRAPDPYTALSRFEKLTESLLRLPQTGHWAELLSNPKVLKDLARILGASDFLWEDFIRMQYESLLPILTPHVGGERLSDPSTFVERLDAELENAETFEEKRAAVNRFKDREIFLLDLDSILSEDVDFRTFAEGLTSLAEAVVAASLDVISERLRERHGVPLGVADIETPWAMFGLGKLGGAALGYASDIELLLIYEGSGPTTGERPVSAAEYFSALMRELALFIQTKREGIFAVDLRLRPYGNSGPLASSLENFCTYYGPTGPAHPFERLALVRLRPIAGDPELGAQVTRLRDEFVYASGRVDFGALRDLRQRQYAEKARPGAYNAKFSPGALVDLEYTVQILQVVYAKDVAELRSPRIHVALEELGKRGLVDIDECRRLNAAYDFLRRLINGLRMLRGSAQDLFLPPADSDEFVHLARRIGYEPGELGAADQLQVDFQSHTATVRTFVEHYLGRASLPDPFAGNIADVILSGEPPEELWRPTLERAGFRDPERAFRNWLGLSSRGSRAEFARLAVLAADRLGGEPDADMALNNWERFVSSLDDPPAHFRQLRAQPQRLGILLGIFSRSQFLAETLIRRPEEFDWITAAETLREAPSARRHRSALRRVSSSCDGAGERLDAIRRYRQRELLRIGTRDMILGVDTASIMAELSVLADTIVQATLDEIWAEFGASGETRDRLCVLAFGKLGGVELNYSSDIDLIGVYSGSSSDGAAREFAAVLSRLATELSRATGEGRMYRVDFRLRPYGRSGSLVSSIGELVEYYEKKARLWEIQALLKLRPIAGNTDVGYELLDALYPVLRRPHDRSEVTGSIQRLRDEAVRNTLTRSLGSGIDVKNGTGGIRDVEFLVQGLQLVSLARSPRVLGGNTLEALCLLADEELIGGDIAADLADDYVFLRRVEHYLQILHDRQIHSLPSRKEEREALARRLQIDGADAFTERLDACLSRVHRAYVRHLFGEGTDSGREAGDSV